MKLAAHDVVFFDSHEVLRYRDIGSAIWEIQTLVEIETMFIQYKFR